MRRVAIVTSLLLAGCSDPSVSATRTIVVSVEGCPLPVAIGWTEDCAGVGRGESNWTSNFEVLVPGARRAIAIPTDREVCIRAFGGLESHNLLSAVTGYGSCWAATEGRGNQLVLRAESHPTTSFAEYDPACTEGGETPVPFTLESELRRACLYESPSEQTVVSFGRGGEFSGRDFLALTTITNIRATLREGLSAAAAAGYVTTTNGLVFGYLDGSGAAVHAVIESPLRRLVLFEPERIDPDLDLAALGGSISRRQGHESHLALAIHAADPWADWARLYNLPLPFDDTGKIDPQAWATWQARSPLRWLEAHASEMTIAVIGDPALEARLRTAGARIVTLEDETKLDPMWNDSPTIPVP